MSEVPTKVMIPSTSQSRAASMSSGFVLVNARISASKPSFAIAVTLSLSLSETIGKPASIWLILNWSSLRAISNFSSKLKQTPGVCSPSLRVVS